MNAIVDKPSPPVQAELDRQSVAEPIGRSVLVPPARPGRWRRRLLLGVAGIALLAGAGSFGRYYWETGRFLQSTDDAYVQADNVTASPRVAGYISEVDVTDNQPVNAGDVLARIDDRDFRTALDQAKASRRLRRGEHSQPRRPARAAAIDHRGGAGVDRRRPGGGHLRGPGLSALPGPGENRVRQRSERAAVKFQHPPEDRQPDA